MKFEPVEVTWRMAVAALQAKKIDLVCVLDATPKCNLAVNSPQRLLYYALAVLADDNFSIKTWEDLNKSGVKMSVNQCKTIDTYVAVCLNKFEIFSFPSNCESVAAFHSGRVNAVSLFHPPLIAMRKKIGRGLIVLPYPIRQSASSAGL